MTTIFAVVIFIGKLINLSYGRYNCLTYIRYLVYKPLISYHLQFGTQPYLSLIIDPHGVCVLSNWLYASMLSQQVDFQTNINYVMFLQRRS